MKFELTDFVIMKKWCEPAIGVKTITKTFGPFQPLLQLH